MMEAVFIDIADCFMAGYLISPGMLERKAIFVDIADC